MKTVFSTLIILCLAVGSAQAETGSPQKVMTASTGLGANDLGDIVWDGASLWVTGSGTLSNKLWGSGDKSTDWITYRAEPGFGRGAITAIHARNDTLVTAWRYTAERNGEPVTTGDGLSISVDHGTNWEHIPLVSLFPDRAGYAYPGSYTVTYDIVRDSGTLWCSTTSGFLLKSADFGGTWRNIIPGDGELNLLDPNHHGQCVDAYGDTVWVGTFQGMNLSTDGGESWSNFSWPTDDDQTVDGVKPGNFCVAVEHVVLDGTTHVWVGSQPYYQYGQYGICHTDDNGATWDYRTTEFSAWNFAFGTDASPVATVGDSTVFAASDKGLVVSHDFGGTWETMHIRQSDTNAWEPDIEVFGVLIAEDQLWVTSSDGIAKSSDWGETWRIFRGNTRVRSLDEGDWNYGVASTFDDVETYAFPNPFTPARRDRNYSRTRIQYALTDDADISIAVYDFSGRCIREIINSEFRSGGRAYRELWDGRDSDGAIVPNGVYFYEITTHKGDTARGKIMVLD